MTGTIELIIILLLMVIQHGGDDVSCKRSIRECGHGEGTNSSEIEEMTSNMQAWELCSL